MSRGHCSRHWPYLCKSRHRSLEKSALAAFVDFGLQGVSKMAIQLDLAAEGFSSQVNRGWLVEFDLDVYGLFLFFQVLKGLCPRRRLFQWTRVELLFKLWD